MLPSPCSRWFFPFVHSSHARFPRFVLASASPTKMPPSFSVLPRRAVTISPPTSPYLPFHLDSSSVRSVFSPLFHPAALLNTPFVRCSSPVRGGSSFDPPIKEFSIGCVSARKPPPSLPPTRNFTLSFFHLLSLSLSLSLSSFLLRVLDSTAKSIRRGGRERNDKPRDGKRWEEKARERERERERKEKSTCKSGWEEERARFQRGRMAVAIRRPIHRILKGIIPGQCSRRAARSAPRREIKWPPLFRARTEQIASVKTCRQRVRPSGRLAHAVFGNPLFGESESSSSS